LIQVQQNFGLVMDRTLTEDDVIVERYGVPLVSPNTVKRILADAGLWEAVERGAGKKAR
jgi:predicted transcriptional regulator